MSRPEVAIVAGVLFAALGLGLWIHPGVALLVIGSGLALWGVLELGFTSETEDTVAESQEIAA